MHATTATIDICVNRTYRPNIPNLERPYWYATPQAHAITALNRNKPYWSATPQASRIGPQHLRLKAYNPSWAHGLTLATTFPEKSTLLRWIRPLVFVKCVRAVAIDADMLKSQTSATSRQSNPSGRTWIDGYHRVCTTVPTSDRSTHLYECRVCLLTAKDRKPDLRRVHRVSI
uniref:Uncharacterized protein n=1 Tax=Ananas comosus var. bracteatus TaxID=296719 RepID=A0A6V7P2B7_ANACO|nr:unnamed protein product [Ananas comosus var. bracteatus]